MSLDDAIDAATPAQLAAIIAVGPGRSGESSCTHEGQSLPLCLLIGGSCLIGCHVGHEKCRLPSSSLDTSETSENFPSALPPEQATDYITEFLNRPPEAIVSQEITLDTTSQAGRFRHSGWWDHRKKVFASLKRNNVPDSRLRQFASCGTSNWIMQSDIDPTRFKLHSNNCHDRLCTPCANQRSFRLTECLKSLIEGKSLTFVTLTLCGKAEPLSGLIDRLYKHFKALRNHPLWSEAVIGGAAFLEIKYSDKARRWHPHLHIIMEARFIDQQALSSVWRGITKDSYIVDIRKVRDPEVTARYVTKYASKPLNMSFANSPELLDEAVNALKGRRLALCFGTWYGTPLDADEDTIFADDEIDVAGWHNYASLNEVIQDANAGDAAARAVIVAVGGEAKWRSSLLLD